MAFPKHNSLEKNDVVIKLAGVTSALFKHNPYSPFMKGGPPAVEPCDPCGHLHRARKLSPTTLYRHAMLDLEKESRLRTYIKSIFTAATRKRTANQEVLPISGVARKRQWRLSL